jgi:hypothetical protein
MARGRHAGRPRWSPKWNLHRWQALFAVSLLGSSSVAVPAGTVTPFTASPTPAASGSASLPQIQGLLPEVAITSFSEVPSPPSPGEVYTFSGTVKNWSIASASGAEIFMVAPSPRDSADGRARTWLVSPPAQVLYERDWLVKWKLPYPPAGESWKAVVMLRPLSDSTESLLSSILSPLTAEYISHLAQFGLHSSWAISASASVRMVGPYFRRLTH